jgi:hypothetical protein
MHIERPKLEDVTQIGYMIRSGASLSDGLRVEVEITLRSTRMNGARGTANNEQCKIYYYTKPTSSCV